MPSIERALSGDELFFRLEDELQEITKASADRQHAARTLLKNGPLRVTLINVAPGGTIHEHHADGPITVHVLSGELQFKTPQKTHLMQSGDLLALDGGVRHSVESMKGASFLLTIASA